MGSWAAPYYFEVVIIIFPFFVCIFLLYFYLPFSMITQGETKISKYSQKLDADLRFYHLH